MGIYSLGPFLPATAESVSEAPYSDDTWNYVAQVSADDGRAAVVTASTYDAEDETYVLKAYNFQGFTAVPTAATIVGIQSEFYANWVTGATAPQIHLGQLLSNQRTRVGTNKYASTEVMSAGLTTHSKGAWNDMWGNALSAAWVRHSGFGVGYAVSAQAANTDISAQYIRMTVWYTTPDTYTVTSNGSEIIVTPDSSYGKQTGGGTEYAYAGTVEAKPAAQSYIVINKVLNLDYGRVVVASDSVYAASYGAGGVAYPYTGSVEATVSEDSARARAKAYVGAVAIDVDASSTKAVAKAYIGSVAAVAQTEAVKSRAKDYAGEIAADADIGGTYQFSGARTYQGSVEASAQAQSDRAFGKAYEGLVETEAVAEADASSSLAAPTAYSYAGEVSAIVEFDAITYVWGEWSDAEEFGTSFSTGFIEASIEAGGAYSLFSAAGTARTYQGTVAATVQAQSERKRAKVYAGAAGSVIVVDGVYSTTGAYAFTYIGTCEVVSQISSRVAKGKAYRADTRLVVQVAGDYAIGQPTSHPYAGTVLLSVSPGASYSADLIVPISVSVAGTVLLSVSPGASYIAYLIAPPVSVVGLEPVPTRPGAIDGAYTEGTQDGVWTEYPAHGAYTYVGYLSEFKPFHRATHTLEPVPSSPYSPGIADGSYAAGGEILAGGDVGGIYKEGKPS